MEKFQTDILEAVKYFRSAEHLTFVTYPLLKDNKLLWAITKNLYLTSYNAVNAILHYEHLYRRIRVLPADFDLRMQIFEKDIAPRMKLNGDISKVINNLRILMKQHKESTVEFSRNNRLIICNEGYTNIKTLDLEMLKSYIVVIHTFIHLINRLDKDV